MCCYSCVFCQSPKDLSVEYPGSSRDWGIVETLILASLSLRLRATFLTLLKQRWMMYDTDCDRNKITRPSHRNKITASPSYSTSLPEPSPKDKLLALSISIISESPSGSSLISSSLPCPSSSLGLPGPWLVESPQREVVVGHLLCLS